MRKNVIGIRKKIFENRKRSLNKENGIRERKRNSKKENGIPTKKMEFEKENGI